VPVGSKWHPEARRFAELLEEIVASPAAALLDHSLRMRCHDALGVSPQQHRAGVESPFCPPSESGNRGRASRGEAVDSPAVSASATRCESTVSAKEAKKLVSKEESALSVQCDKGNTTLDPKAVMGFTRNVSFDGPEGDATWLDEDAMKEVMTPGGARGTQSRTVVRAGQRRFTLSASLSPVREPSTPSVEDADEEGVPTPAKAQGRWTEMQTRLAEVKLQTMLQTFTPQDGEPVYRVVLTGGPCAGKSTGTALLRQELEKNGINVFCVPEAATLLIGGGCGVIFKECDDQKLFRFQLALLETQLALEDAFYAIAKACGKKGVILCDRGSMDGRAFCSEEIWQRILDEGDWTTQELRDGRYDMVLHLVTAADGAVDFYGNDTNNVRTETAEQACEQDRNLQKMWTGHPKIKIIDNSTNFSEKMDRTVQPILELCDINRRPGPYKKYLLETELDKESMSEHVHAEAAEVMILFLRGSKPDNQIRLYQRQDGEHTTYSYQNFRKTAAQGVYRVESTLSRQQYVSMQMQVDPSCSRVVRTAQSFVYKNQYMELGTYIEPQARKGETYLWVETTRDHEGHAMEVVLPEFLTSRGLIDVTDEGEETDYNLAKGGLSSLATVAMKRKQVLEAEQKYATRSERGSRVSVMDREEQEQGESVLMTRNSLVPTTGHETPTPASDAERSPVIQLTSS